ncbi:PilZ domain-containing protein [Cohaesibacter sp. ES.047]|uniref:PilZ domain-containing protein n=1 Tax=Cohaesibacter sp. ES.047 TaxID=1798205 RepID=UPI000BB98E3E|nr:PilZ domain-containing protein [Cohaesibacter sp. ES.047]SNY92049.1 PilZ domain-containing protein [Cohaesibacter sp. ES.047]
MTVTSERRREDRKRVLKGGKIFYNNFSISLDCTIRNESEHGMQIRIDPQAALPSHFALLNRKEGTLAEANLVWKHGDSVGVELSTEMKDVRTFGKSDIRRMSIIATRG